MRQDNPHVEQALEVDMLMLSRIGQRQTLAEVRQGACDQRVVVSLETEVLPDIATAQVRVRESVPI